MSKLPVVSRTTLRPAQASLYDLIVEKVKNNQSVEYAEAENIWIDKACRNVTNGVPYGYRYYPLHDGTNNWSSRLEPLDDKEIAFNVMNWLTRNIGILVLKGYLEVIPKIELTKPNSLSVPKSLTNNNQKEE